MHSDETRVNKIDKRKLKSGRPTLYVVATSTEMKPQFSADDDILLFTNTVKLSTVTSTNVLWVRNCSAYTSQ